MENEQHTPQEIEQTLEILSNEARTVTNTRRLIEDLHDFLNSENARILSQLNEDRVKELLISSTDADIDFLLEDAPAERKAEGREQIKKGDIYALDLFDTWRLIELYKRKAKPIPAAIYQKDNTKPFLTATATAVTDIFEFLLIATDDKRITASVERKNLNKDVKATYTSQNEQIITREDGQNVYMGFGTLHIERSKVNNKGCTIKEIQDLNVPKLQTSPNLLEYIQSCAWETIQKGASNYFYITDKELTEIGMYKTPQKAREALEKAAYMLAKTTLAYRETKEANGKKTTLRNIPNVPLFATVFIGDKETAQKEYGEKYRGLLVNVSGFYDLVKDKQLYGYMPKEAYGKDEKTFLLIRMVAAEVARNKTTTKREINMVEVLRVLGEPDITSIIKQYNASKYTTKLLKYIETANQTYKAANFEIKLTTRGDQNNPKEFLSNGKLIITHHEKTVQKLEEKKKRRSPKKLPAPTTEYIPTTETLPSIEVEPLF